MSSSDEADVVVDILVVLRPEVHHHAFGADWSAGLSSVFYVVLGALFRPTAVGMVAVVASVVEAFAHVDAHGHPAGLYSSLLGAFLFVDEACGALLALRSLLLVAGALLVLALSLGLSLTLVLVSLSLSSGSHVATLVLGLALLLTGLGLFLSGGHRESLSLTLFLVSLS